MLQMQTSCETLPKSQLTALIQTPLGFFDFHSCDCPFVNRVRSIRNSQRAQSNKCTSEWKVATDTRTSINLYGTVHDSSRQLRDSNLNGGNLVAYTASPMPIHGRRT
jgi:hypothetical protein